MGRISNGDIVFNASGSFNFFYCVLLCYPDWLLQSDNGQVPFVICLTLVFSFGFCLSSHCSLGHILCKNNSISHQHCNDVTGMWERTFTTPFYKTSKGIIFLINIDTWIFSPSVQIRFGRYFFVFLFSNGKMCIIIKSHRGWTSFSLCLKSSASRWVEVFFFSRR